MVPGGDTHGSDGKNLPGGGGISPLFLTPKSRPHMRVLKRTAHCTARVRGCNALVQCTPFRKAGRDAEKIH